MKWILNVLVMAAVSMAVVAMPASAVCSNLVVHYSLEDGDSPGGVVMNRLLDETCGMSGDQAKTHHYELKAAVGEAYIAATEPGLSRSGASSDAFSAAVMSVGPGGGAGAGAGAGSGDDARSGSGQRAR